MEAGGGRNIKIKKYKNKGNKEEVDNELGELEIKRWSRAKKLAVIKGEKDFL